MLLQFPKVFSGRPGRTHLVQHQIDLTTPRAIRVPFHALNPHRRKLVKTLDIEMTALNAIEDATGDFATNIVIVETPNKPPRLCIDYRQLNTYTLYDPPAMP